MLDGTRPCTKVSRKRVPSPLTSRARTYAPACLTHSPRSIKGRQSEHRDPVARQSPGSEERDCRSAAAPARRVTCLARVGIGGVRAAESVLLERSDARVRAALASGSHTWAPTVRRSMRNEGPVHVTAAVDLLRRHAVPSLPPPILWMLGGGQGLLTRLGFFVSPHLKREKLLLPFDRRNDSIDGTLSISCALVVQKPWLAEGSEVAARCRRRRNGCVVGASKSPADVDAPNHRASGPHGGVHPRRAEGSARVGSR